MLLTLVFGFNTAFINSWTQSHDVHGLETMVGTSDGIGNLEPLLKIVQKRTSIGLKKTPFYIWLINLIYSYQQVVKHECFVIFLFFYYILDENRKNNPFYLRFTCTKNRIQWLWKIKSISNQPITIVNALPSEINTDSYFIYNLHLEQKVMCETMCHWLH